LDPVGGSPVVTARADEENRMKVPHNAHVALVDGERFVLMRNTGQIFAPKLETVEEPVLEPTNFSVGVRNQEKRLPSASTTGTAHLDEFAHGAAAAQWLNAKALSGELERVLVIADPRTLGEMRRHYHKELQSRLVGELAKDLSGLPPREVEQAIAAA
jgi:protein required for attachment to host cells